MTNTSIIPSLVIVGRPNVGKSSLFNRLTKTHQALVADFPGLTRDRLYGHGVVGPRPYLIIDTGGLTTGKQQGIDVFLEQQTQQAITEADHILFLVDSRAGLTALDQLLAQKLRKLNKRISLVINKAEGLIQASLISEFSALGFSDIHIISAAHAEGIEPLMEAALQHFPM